MKKILLLASIVFYLSTAQAQQKDSLSYEKQIGFNVTELITQILNFSSSSSSFSKNNYFLTYKKRNEKGNFRFGLGGGFGVEEKVNGRASNVQINLRFGTERYIDFGKRWRAYYGFDVKPNFYLVEEAGSNIEQIEGQLGFGPLAGIQFRLNSRLSLSTEVSYDIVGSVKYANEEARWGAFGAFNPPDFIVLGFDF